MPSPSADRPAARAVRLRLGPDEAETTTILTFAEPAEAIDLATDFERVSLSTRGVGRASVEDGVVRLRDLAEGALVEVSGHVAYHRTVHGLCRWTDPTDGSAYVVGSGALGGAPHFAACGAGPGDRMATELTVDSPGVVRVARAPGTGDGLEPTMAGHHLGLVAGPWTPEDGNGVELLSRHALDRPGELEALATATRQALDWLLEWFGTPEHAEPWGSTYTQVLLPDAPWLAMEHPGCVLLSERLLDSSPGQRVAVLAHEAAHQWLGNLVSPRDWVDVGIFEGLAELLGQLACEEIVGPRAAGDLARRRATGPLALPPGGTDLRTLAATAGLAEVAGPVQHAEVFRGVRAEVGAAVFRTRVQELVSGHAGTACGSLDVWAALGVPPRHPRRLRLPAGDQADAVRWRAHVDRLAAGDPATSAAAARRMFRECAPGRRRVHEALAVLSDPSTPEPVVAGLAAELVRSRT